jgi:hypothetical protein
MKPDDCIKKACEARDYWLNNHLDEYDYILLFPQNDERLKSVLCDNFKAMLLYGGTGEAPKKALVLFTGAPLKNGTYESRAISSETADDILCLYSMYEFTDKLIVGSFELPYGRKLFNFLNCGIASENELADAVFFNNRAG